MHQILTKQYSRLAGSKGRFKVHATQRLLDQFCDLIPKFNFSSKQVRITPLVFRPYVTRTERDRSESCEALR